MNIAENSQNQQVTAIISHYVRPGRERGYEEWLQGISQAARQFPGHGGVTILRPRSDFQLEYVIILRFDSYKNLCQWMRSPVRKKWIERAKPLTEKPEDVQVITGLEALVTLPGKITASSPPPRYKTAFVTWIGVYFCVVLLGHILAPLLVDLPHLIHQAIVTGLVVILLTYMVMPQLTRLFYQWLHPSALDG
ncbi:antibiotic biosynthesis monooxygenase [Pleurocapsales cyanobacterium LEGE 10410]|nr:antibiotic biosynthesis monooxygenase [Pleurocapsales cyanobacterium LEGE 10410]